jgi:murein DD-endopeptidase MepM/ murein hydrolase activator NlpD
MCVLTFIPSYVVAAVLSVLPLAGRTASDGERPWPWPLAPVPTLVERFDAPDSDYGPGHRGIDLRGSPRQSVTAATSGDVTFAGRVAGRSVVVVRQPGGLKVTYEPVHPAVVVGQRVSPGWVLGTLERSGSHCAPATCLHVGVRRGGAYVDPLPFFGPRQVRLKPLDGQAWTPGGTPPGRQAGDATGHDVASEVDPFGASDPGSGTTSRVAAGALVTVAAGAAAAAAVRRRQARG